MQSFTYNMFRISRRFFSHCRVNNAENIERRLENIENISNGLFILSISSLFASCALLLKK